jgi:hypothetical protein
MVKKCKCGGVYDSAYNESIKPITKWIVANCNKCEKGVLVKYTEFLKETHDDHYGWGSSLCSGDRGF